MALPSARLGRTTLETLVLLGHPLRLKPVTEVAYMPKRRLDGVPSYFAHRITNAGAGAEGLNSRIQAISTTARGYRNHDHFKTAIYFHCGGLNLYPATHSNPG